MFDDVTFAVNPPALNSDSLVRVKELGTMTVLTWVPDAQSNTDAANFERDFAAWHGVCYRWEQDLGPVVQVFLSTEPI